MTNALASETSPYLRQHAENPVDWLPWGEQALARAAAENKPLLVSIGYSSCHWCHVMERESFEDVRTAELMNEAFVCVKVDREERPDVDALYMEAVQGMTGRGGWPLNVFLTPEQLPFYGGTYYPPEPRHGMPAWTQVLQAIAESWSERSEEIRAGGEQLRERLSGGATLRPSNEPIDAAELDRAVARLRESFDTREGGFGGAPKFPQASALEFLLLRGEREMTLQTLRAMASGGIYDQLGGGFSRYSVDRALDGAALREDALRQRAARARCTCTAGRRSASVACSRCASRRSRGRCARCAARRAASTRRSTPTRRASRAATTCGRWPSCASCSAQTPRRRSPGSARARRATSRTRTTRRRASTCCRTAARASPTPRPRRPCASASASACSPPARSGCARASTTSG